MDRGNVVIGPDFVGGNSRRPYIIINNEEHPFSSEECLVVLVTTTERNEAIPLPEEKFSEGKLPKESFAPPWTVTTMKNEALQDRIGRLNEKTLDSIVDQVKKYID